MVEVHTDSFYFSNGTVKDVDLLPKDLSMPANSSKDTQFDKIIKFGPLEFDYSDVRLGLENGSKKLRIFKDGDKVAGFYVLTQKKECLIINQLWVSDEYRGKGLGQKLVNDAISLVSHGMVVMDIWGGEPMMNLAKKMGFTKCDYNGMANAFCLNK